MFVDGLRGFLDGAVQMGQARSELGFVGIVVNRQRGSVIVLGEFGVSLFRFLHRLVAVPIDIVFACHIMKHTVRKGIFGGRTSRQYCYDQQTDTNFDEYFCFLLQRFVLYSET